MKLKTCKSKLCGQKFAPRNSLQAVCGLICSIDYAKQQRDARIAKELKADKKAVKTRLNELKSKSEYMKEAQQAFNAYIRARDGKICISCGTQKPDIQYHAGHYRTTKACPELRFNETVNVNSQCSTCNNHLSGNILKYRINLIKKVGLDLVEWVEGNHPPKKYTIEDLKNIRKVYKEKLKLLG